MSSSQLPLKSNQLLTDDLRFLIACCQAEPTQDGIKQIDSSIRKLLTPHSSLLIAASQHGILPLVYKTLKRLNDKNFLDTQHATLNAFLLELKQAYLSIARRNMLMSAELIHILKMLEKDGIDALAFKGPTLAQMAYGDITLRQYSDIDILIHSEDRKKAADLLEKKGYIALLSMGPKQEQVWYRNAKEMSLYQPEKNIHIDLQWQFFDNDYPLHYTLDTLWKTARVISLNGNPVRTFSADSLLIYLCIHGSKHLWERIGWIKDIDLLIRSEALNWKQIEREIDGSGFERMFLLGLYLANSYFKTPLPDTVNEQIKGQVWLEKLEYFIINDWEAKKNIFHNSAAMLHLFPTPGLKLKYLIKVIIKPAKNEYRYVDLPENFYWAYYLLRPYLLIRKYLLPADHASKKQ